MKITQRATISLKVFRSDKSKRCALVFCVVLLLALTYGLPSGLARTILVTTSGGFAAALNDANAGDTIQLKAGNTFTGTFALPVKPCAVPNNCTDADYITITSSGAVPQAGLRVSPAVASQMNFPKIVSPGNNQEAIITAAGAHHYQFIGVEIVSKNDNQQLSNLISLGEGVSGGHYVQDSLDKVPHHLKFDRCYIHADGDQVVIRGVALNSATTEIINCYISNFKSKKIGGSDAQAVWGWNGPGPFQIENNYLEGSSENVGFGGATAMSYPSTLDQNLLPECIRNPNVHPEGLIPSCITIRHNTIAKPASWKDLPDSTAWQIKNLLELKAAQHVTIDGNLFEHTWAADQSYAIVLNVRNQDNLKDASNHYIPGGINPWNTINNIRFTNNIVRHVGNVFQFFGRDNVCEDKNSPDTIRCRSVQMDGVTIENNLFYDVGPNPPPPASAGGIFMLITYTKNVTVNHNTIDQSGQIIVTLTEREETRFNQPAWNNPPFDDTSGPLYTGQYGTYKTGYSGGFKMTNNLVRFGGGINSGEAFSTFNTLELYFPSFISDKSNFSKNVIAGADPTPTPLPQNRTYPNYDYYSPPAESFSGLFINPANGDYRLQAKEYQGAGTDGADIGYYTYKLDKARDPAIKNIIDDTNFFVYQHYLDFLNRVPDQGGLDYWGGQINTCGSDALCLLSHRINVSAAFFIELEFQDTGYFVYRFYKASLGRQPTYAEFTLDRAQVVGGADLAESKQAFARDWVQRPAFLARYPTSMSNSSFVNALYDTAGLTPYSAERAAHIAQMNGGKTRDQVLMDVIDIQAFKQREYNGAFVRMQYFGYLRRDPDADGEAFWLNVLNNNEPNNYRGMVCSFITSREYQERFSPAFTHTNQECASINSQQGGNSIESTGSIPPPPVDTVWVEDSLPAGAAPHAYSDNPDGNGAYESWTWNNTDPAQFSGISADQSHLISGLHQVYFDGATQTLSVNTGDSLFAYVYLDPVNPPSEIMLQWNDGNWDHRAYWGANNINAGTNGTDSRRYIGPLPATGKWVRLEVPVTQVGLGGHTLNGMAFTMYNGKASWDYAGRSKPQELFYNAPFNLTAALSGSQVNLTWSAPTGITANHYQVERSLSKNGPFTVLPNSPTTTSYADSTATNGVSYFYRVCAVDSSGNYTNYSNVASTLRSLWLDGNNSYVNVPGSTASSLNLTGALTIEAWIKPSSTPTAAQIVSRYGLSDGGYQLGTYYGKLRMDILHTGSSYANLVGNTAISPNVWHHVAAVFDGSQYRLYLDGVLDASMTLAYAPTSSASSLAIGRDSNGGQYFAGWIDEARVSAGARYTSNFTPPVQLSPDASTRGLWKFDGQTVNDLSGSTNNGTLQGSATYSTDVVARASSGNSLSANGSTAYCAVPNSTSINIAGPITIEAWLKLNSINSSYQDIVSRESWGQAGTGGGYELSITPAGKARLDLYQGPSSYTTLIGNTAVSAGAWHHVAAIFDGSQIRIYLDGNLDGSLSSTSGPASGTSNINIGKSTYATYYFGGLIDEVRLSSGARYSANFTPSLSLTSDSNTKGLWKFDDQTANDSSGNANNGTIQGGASYSTDIP